MMAAYDPACNFMIGFQVGFPRFARSAKNDSVGTRKYVQAICCGIGVVKLGLQQQNGKLSTQSATGD